MMDDDLEILIDDETNDGEITEEQKREMMKATTDLGEYWAKWIAGEL